MAAVAMAIHDHRIHADAVHVPEVEGVYGGLFAFGVTGVREGMDQVRWHGIVLRRQVVQFTLIGVRIQ